MNDQGNPIQDHSHRALAAHIFRRVLGVIAGLATVTILDLLAEYLRLVLYLRTDLFGRGLGPQITPAYMLLHFATGAAVAWIGIIAVQLIDQTSTRLERCVPALFLLAIYIENLRIAEGRASVLAVVAGLVIGAVAALWLRVSDLLIRRWRST